MPKIQPGIYIDKEVWLAFKEKFQGCASEKIEALMKSYLEAKELEEVSTVLNVSAVNIANPTEWNISYSSTGLSISNSTHNNGSIINILT